MLSFRDSLSNPIDSMTPGPLNGRAVFSPGSDYIAIDPSKLPVGTVIPDNIPPGHVSVIGPTVDQLKDAMTGRGSFP